jgi:hypothetical protein
MQGSNNSTIVLGSSDNRVGKGIVDIIAGRTLSTSAVVNSRGYSEVDKANPATADNPQVGVDAAARVYLGMNENADYDFGVSIDGISGSGSGSCVVLKGAQVRLIATNDVKITVGTTGAGIIIKPDGNIVIIPSASGVIKLGGDDADKAILCQTAVQAVPGSITAAPVISTAGGIIGAKEIIGTGLFASKVLVK